MADHIPTMVLAAIALFLVFVLLGGYFSHIDHEPSTGAKVAVGVVFVALVGDLIAIVAWIIFRELMAVAS